MPEYAEISVYHIPQARTQDFTSGTSLPPHKRWKEVLNQIEVKFENCLRVATYGGPAANRVSLTKSAAILL
jgi:hypothetical protein